MGSERRSMIINDEEKQGNCEYTKQGMRLLTVLLPHADPIHKVTIIPRGMALGVDTAVARRATSITTLAIILNDQIAILLGGRLAEELTTRRRNDGCW